MDQVQKMLERLSCQPKKETGTAVDTHQLAQACIYVLDMPLPPKKHRHLSATCCITGISLKAEVSLCTSAPTYFFVFGQVLKIVFFVS